MCVLRYKMRCRMGWILGKAGSESQTVFMSGAGAGAAKRGGFPKAPHRRRTPRSATAPPCRIEACTGAHSALFGSGMPPNRFLIQCACVAVA
jgi:hypothetical protein